VSYAETAWSQPIRTLSGGGGQLSGHAEVRGGVLPCGETGQYAIGRLSTDDCNSRWSIPARLVVHLLCPRCRDY